MRPSGEHAHHSVSGTPFRPAVARTSLVRRLLREHRHRRLRARLERVTLREHLAYWQTY